MKPAAPTPLRNDVTLDVDKSMIEAPGDGASLRYGFKFDDVYPELAVPATVDEPIITYVKISHKTKQKTRKY